ncbi:hypothetical protein CYMTET_32114, partial [Cymbomonas tetramitiformis]
MLKSETNTYTIHIKPSRSIMFGRKRANTKYMSERDRQSLAVLTIQRVWKGWRMRKLFKVLRRIHLSVVCEKEKLFANRFRHCKTDEEWLHECDSREEAALLLQRCLRGYWGRKAAHALRQGHQKWSQNIHSSFAELESEIFSDDLHEEFDLKGTRVVAAVNTLWKDVFDGMNPSEERLKMTLLEMMNCALVWKGQTKNVTKMMKSEEFYFMYEGEQYYRDKLAGVVLNMWEAFEVSKKGVNFDIFLEIFIEFNVVWCQWQTQTEVSKFVDQLRLKLNRRLAQIQVDLDNDAPYPVDFTKVEHADRLLATEWQERMLDKIPHSERHNRPLRTKQLKLRQPKKKKIKTEETFTKDRENEIANLLENALDPLAEEEGGEAAGQEKLDSSHSRIEAALKKMQDTARQQKINQRILAASEGAKKRLKEKEEEARRQREKEEDEEEQARKQRLSILIEDEGMDADGEEYSPEERRLSEDELRVRHKAEIAARLAAAQQCSEHDTWDLAAIEEEEHIQREKKVQEANDRKESMFAQERERLAHLQRDEEGHKAKANLQRTREQIAEHERAMEEAAKKEAREQAVLNAMLQFQQAEVHSAAFLMRVQVEQDEKKREEEEAAAAAAQEAEQVAQGEVKEKEEQQKVAKMAKAKADKEARLKRLKLELKRRVKQKKKERARLPQEKEAEAKLEKELASSSKWRKARAVIESEQTPNKFGSLVGKMADGSPKTRKSSTFSKSKRWKKNKDASTDDGEITDEMADAAAEGAIAAAYAAGANAKVAMRLGAAAKAQLFVNRTLARTRSRSRTCAAIAARPSIGGQAALSDAAMDPISRASALSDGNETDGQDGAYAEEVVSMLDEESLKYYEEQQRILRLEREQKEAEERARLEAIEKEQRAVQDLADAAARAAAAREEAERQEAELQAQIEAASRVPSQLQDTIDGATAEIHNLAGELTKFKNDRKRHIAMAANLANANLDDEIRSIASRRFKPDHAEAGPVSPPKPSPTLTPQPKVPTAAQLARQKRLAEFYQRLMDGTGPRSKRERAASVWSGQLVSTELEGSSGSDEWSDRDSDNEFRDIRVRAKKKAIT